MIILGLGSNLSSTFGDRFQNIDLAISYLKSFKIQTIKKSSYYETPSYPDISNPKFINVVIQVSTNLSLDGLISNLIKVEEKLERKRKIKNDPRTCDIDIIDYNNQILNFKHKNFNFEIPHRSLSSRNFVLLPLKEIVPDWHHPISNDSINTLINKLSNEEKRSILKITKT